MAHDMVSAQKETLHEESIDHILSSSHLREVLPHRTENGLRVLKTHGYVIIH